MQIRFREVIFWNQKSTPFEKQALNRITLDIPAGQFVAVMGHAGSGKTTLTQMINGLVVPSEGEVWVGNDRITNKRKDMNRLRVSIGYAFQYPEHQLLADTVYHDIAFSLRRLNLDEEEIRNKVEIVMNLVGLPFEQYKDRSPFQLSRGQMRRVALAGILASDPNMLILDEPTAGLDPLGRYEVLSLIKTLQLKQGMTTVLITHRLEEALEYADRIIVMKKGTVFLDLKPREARDRLPELIEAGLTSTPMLRLIQEIEQRIPESIPGHIVKENELISHLIKWMRQEK